MNPCPGISISHALAAQFTSNTPRNFSLFEPAHFQQPDSKLLKEVMLKY
jgi:hypothetical protein